ncbi:MAG TPA: chorismate-binding protein, partial [Verrucomicrobiae bacterium]|nr:chorismate-binding protein [Verrucomicrobiae bacterium]
MASLAQERGRILLRSALQEGNSGRYSFVTARPFLTFRSSAAQCEMRSPEGVRFEFGDPWRVLEGLLSRYELHDELDLPFPTGGCFGFWGYDLKNFIEPSLRRRAVDDLEFPDCHLGFHDSLVAFDHVLGTCWIVATGLERDGSRNPDAAQRQIGFWLEQLTRSAGVKTRVEAVRGAVAGKCFSVPGVAEDDAVSGLCSNVSREQFLAKIVAAQKYIQNGDIYQVNLSHRLDLESAPRAWDLFRALNEVSPAPFSAFIDADD